MSAGGEVSARARISECVSAHVCASEGESASGRRRGERGGGKGEEFEEEEREEEEEKGGGKQSVWRSIGGHSRLAGSFDVLSGRRRNASRRFSPP